MPLSSDFWNTENRYLLAVLLPLIEEAILDGVAFSEADLEEMFQIGFDNALVNTQAIEWARGHTDNLLNQLNTTSQRTIGARIANWIDTPGATLGDLADSIEAILGENRSRAVMIGTTEATRAFAAGNRIGFIESGVRSWRWNTRYDEIVCFPKKTLVQTECGAKNIEQIEPGIKVLTRSGYKTVTRTYNQYPYSGDLIRIRHRGGALVCTADHPIWELGQGWLEAKDFHIGYLIQAIGKQRSKVSGIDHFPVGDAPKTSFAVYNLEIEDDPTFYANGVLVHNCPFCAPLNGKVVEIDTEFAPGVTQPPYHPRCRCFTSPVVRVEEIRI